MTTAMEIMARASHYDACPMCEHTGAYCGGSGHPSCGVFDRGAAAPSRVRVEQDCGPCKWGCSGRSIWSGYCDAAVPSAFVPVYGPECNCCGGN